MKEFENAKGYEKMSWIVCVYVLSVLYFVELVYTLKRYWFVHQTDQKGMNFKKVFLVTQTFFLVLRIVGLILYIESLRSLNLSEPWFLPFNTITIGLPQYVFATSFTIITVFWKELFFLSKSSMLSVIKKRKQYVLIFVLNLLMYLLLIVIYIFLISDRKKESVQTVHTIEATFSSIRDFFIGLYFCIYGIIFVARLKQFKQSNSKFKQTFNKIRNISVILTILFFSNSAFVQWYNYQFLSSSKNSFTIFYLVVFIIDRVIFELLLSAFMIYYISHLKSKKKRQVKNDNNYLDLYQKPLLSDN
ncbi:tobamovirus multiplication protein 1-like isoform x1 [Anaeramoeba flamelloides]|uniref:Tobamovirus multiplication protein 1-like isoform x1 n=1 Tax=Anaeramoeba flamelloides TaxID=1746091 RepID=A0AAV7ZHX9_9EUKA|nr:tobamovirus multiplication protein 1-like isoform x1 [Anaeramoeba flamelloides]